MAEEQPTTAPVEINATAVTESPSEAPTAAATATDSTATPAAPTTNGSEAKITDKDVETAGPQATTAVNAPDGDGTAEVDVAGAAADATPGKNGKRKSVGGVPEHKTKKLNKKKSTAQLNLEAKPGDYYWARLKGHPPWPAIVCAEDMLPETLLATRPVSTLRPDGTYRQDFAEGGKNTRDRTYPIMFLATNEFAWMVNTAITPLDPSECTLKDDKKKMSAPLKQAYEIATKGHDLDYFRGVLEQAQEELREWMEDQKRQEAQQAEDEARNLAKAKEKEEASKEKKKPRKSKGGDGDEMEVDVEGEAKPSKKRKKDVDSDGEAPNAKKTPKAIKLNGPKTPADSATKKPKAKKTVSKPAAAKGDKEVAEEPLTESEKLMRREKTVLYLRHRLQKGFLSREVEPKEEEMSAMADFFTQLEGYADLEATIIRTTKIHKVLKAIVKLQNIPKEDEYNFKERSSTLLTAWLGALARDGGDATAGAAETAATNGDAKSEEPKAEAQDEEATKEPSAAPVETAEPGNDAVDEADLTMVDATEVREDQADDAEAAVEATETKEEVMA